MVEMLYMYAERKEDEDEGNSKYWELLCEQI